MRDRLSGEPRFRPGEHDAIMAIDKVFDDQIYAAGLCLPRMALCLSEQLREPSSVLKEIGHDKHEM